MTQSPQTNALGSVLSKVEPLLRTTWVRSRPTLLATLKSLLSLGQAAATALETQIAAEPASPAPLNFTPVQKAATSFWAKTQPWWVKIIAGVRSRLDSETNRKLSDRAISGILSGLALLLLWLTTSFPLGQSAAPRPVPAVSPQPKAKLAPKSVAATYPADVTNKTAFPKDLTSAPSIGAPATAPIVLAPVKSIAPLSAPAIVAPAAIAPKPVAPVPPNQATPKNIAKPTPEQQLLSGFQALGDGYAPQVIQTAQQDKLANTLRLTLGEAWYGLAIDQQDKLASELLSQTQALKVRSLQLLDKQGNLLARNPIVGNEMIVLLRQLAVE
jgi:hypothetical protein